jgi:hypothetical protein
MQKSSDGSNNFDEAAAGNPRSREPVIGDADDVQKTTYVVGQSTDPNAPDPRNVEARVPSGDGINVAAWLIGLVAALIAIVYAIGVFR